MRRYVRLSDCIPAKVEGFSMNDLLFAVPWWIPTLLAAIGLATAYNGSNRQAKQIRNIGLGLIALALMWGLVSYLVDTDKEKVEKGTREFVACAVAADWPKFKSYLDAEAALITRAGGPRMQGADLLTSIARGTSEAIALKSATFRQMKVEQTSDKLITATFTVLTTQEAAGAGIEHSTWQFDWESTKDGWKIHEIHFIDMNGVPADQIGDVMRRAK